MTIVIIEDEKFTAKDLEKTIQSIEPDATIIATLASVEEAIAFFKKDNQIDLIFSDIELGDGLSFEIFEALNITVPIIFCTAYNQYALEAFKTAGIDYILKPFNKQAIETALLKFQSLQNTFNRPKADYTQLLSLLKDALPEKNLSIIIHQGEKIVPVNSKEIALFFFENNYAFAYTFNGKKHIVSQNMDSLEQLLKPSFFRVNRQHLVNRTAVKDASHHFNRKLIVNLTIPFKDSIIVGKLKITAFTNWLASF